VDPSFATAVVQHATSLQASAHAVETEVHSPIQHTASFSAYETGALAARQAFQFERQASAADSASSHSASFVCTEVNVP
jgi:hypothetical protein